MLIPLSLAKSDMWDGVIISFSNETNNLRGIQFWGYASGWELQFYLTRIMQFLSRISNFSPWAVNYIFVVLAFCLLIFETSKLSNLLQNKKERFEFTTIIVLITFPIWHVLLSSVMTIHLVCLAFGLSSVRLIRSKSVLLTVIGFILMIAAFQLNSLLFYLPVLHYVIDIKNKSRLCSPSPKTISASVGATCYYLVQRIFNKPYGPYLGYNEIISPFSRAGLSAYLFNTMNFLTFLVPCLVLVIVLVLSSVNHQRLTKKLFEKAAAAEHLPLMLSAALVLSSVIPYVAVNKSTQIFWTDEWTQRQAILLAPSLAIFISALVQLLSLKQPKILLALATSLVLGIQSFLLMSGMTEKINRTVYEQQLIHEINLHRNEIQNGRISIIDENTPGPIFRFYESNFLMYRALGNAEHPTLITKKDQGRWKLSDQLPAEEPTAFYTLKEPYETCLTKIYVKSSGFLGIKQMIKNSLRLSSNKSVLITGVLSECQVP